MFQKQLLKMILKNNSKRKMNFRMNLNKWMDHLIHSTNYKYQVLKVIILINSIEQMRKKLTFKLNLWSRNSTKLKNFQKILRKQSQMEIQLWLQKWFLKWVRQTWRAAWPQNLQINKRIGIIKLHRLCKKMFLEI